MREDLVQLYLEHDSVLINSSGYSYLKSCPVEGDIGDTFGCAIVEDIRYQEQASYLFNCWGLKQVEV